MIRRLAVAVSFVAAAFAATVLAGCGGEERPATPPAGGGGGGTAAAPGDDRASWPKKLNVSAIPDVAQNKLLEQYPPFADRLSKELGIEVGFTPVTDYPSTVDGLAAGRLDLVWYGGYTSVQAFRAANGNVERTVCRAEDLKFRSVFVAAPSSGIETLADLKGRKFSFGSQSSTSGHLMPRSFLLKEGLNPEKDFAAVSYSKGHDATAQAVEAGAVDAGALNFKVWEKLVAEKKLDTSKVAVFWTTPEYVDYCWCMRKDLPASLRAAVKKFFLSLDAGRPEDKKLLDLQTATKYVECDDALWAGIEEAARSAGMLKD